MDGPFLTRVISAWDYRQGDLSDFYVPFEADPAAIEESLISLQKKYAYRIAVNTVEEGDIVTLCCRSERPKFYKDNITVNVGKNLYSRELEAQLSGLSVGEEKEVTAEGTKVEVRILKVERTALPELTDAFIAGHFETVHTLAELKAWYVNAQLEDYLKEQASRAADELQRQALEKSKIAVDAGERDSARAAGEKIVREHWAFNGMPLDQMADEKAQEMLGYPSVQSYIEWFAGLSEEDISYAALGYELLLAEGKAPTEESYRRAFQKMTEEEGIPAEQLKEYTFTAYARQTCAEYYRNILETYAYQKIKEKLS